MVGKLQVNRHILSKNQNVKLIAVAKTVIFKCISHFIGKIITALVIPASSSEDSDI